eukprot:TRINITY_DN25668_c0_g1_i1.p1 TRINITY_DN25668_c0_g1~~TRINITY_DN25668_c0_g1_i1.p1  ORF type:complete len:191 (+),score=49.42 TRINITY_DN25668_c0_g1_i1:73-645(+)
MSWEAISSWFYNLLYSLGLWKKEATILLLGLDNAGKTTLIHKLKYDTIKLFNPTERAQLQELKMGKILFKAWDLGGHKAVRSWWRDHFVEADAILFLVDSADSERFEEAKEELQSLLKDMDLNQCRAYCILANKTDLSDAVPLNKLVPALGIEQHLTNADSNSKPIKIFRCSITEGTGYLDAFKWLGDIL